MYAMELVNMTAAFVEIKVKKGSGLEWERIHFDEFCHRVIHRTLGIRPKAAPPAASPLVASRTLARICASKRRLAIPILAD